MTSQHLSAPLYEAALSFIERLRAPLYSPGHKGGRSFPEGFAGRLAAIDLNNVPDMDTLHCPSGPILRAERLLADAYGVRQSFMLVGGSTSGNIASVLATCRPGDTLLVPRNAHKSTIAGVVLAGAIPVWLAPEVDPLFGIAHGVAPATTECALDAHPEAVGVVALHPTYFGTTGDLRALRELTSARGKLLLVDEAHGPHFHFHPDLPRAAEDVGADLIVQSTHKTLSGLSQAAVLHRGSDRVSEARVRRALQLTQTTSPSYPVMASIDLARRQMALEGRECWDEVLALARRARAELADLPDIRILGREHLGVADLDESKLVFGTPGMCGPAWQRVLNRDFGVEPELAGPDYLLCILTVGSRAADVDRLVDAVARTRDARRPAAHAEALSVIARTAAAVAAHLPEAVLAPRDAHFAANEAVPLDECTGRIAAEVVTPYPPGIPLLVSGERIETEQVALLTAIRSAALPVSASDPTLQSLLVIRDET